MTSKKKTSVSKQKPVDTSTDIPAEIENISQWGQDIEGVKQFLASSMLPFMIHPNIRRELATFARTGTVTQEAIEMCESIKNGKFVGRRTIFSPEVISNFVDACLKK